MIKRILKRIRHRISNWWFEKEINQLINEIGKIYFEIRQADLALEISYKQKKPTNFIHLQIAHINKTYKNATALRNKLDSFAPLSNEQEKKLNEVISK